MLGAKRAHRVAVVSIGSGSVSAGIVEHTGDVGTLIVSEHLALPLQERTPEQTVVALKQCIVECAQKMLTRYAATSKSHSVSALYAIIRAPWTRSESIRVEKKFDKEETITAAIVSDLAGESLAQAQNMHEQFLEASIMEVALNGYPTAQPEGKRAQHMVITALICACDPQMRAAAVEGLQAVFPAVPPILRSGTRAILNALRAAQILQDNSCVILDVAQEDTTAIVVRDGLATQESFIIEGVRSMLARAWPKGIPEDALSLMRMIARDECNQSACAEAQDGLASMEPELAKSFGEFFAKLSVSAHLPNRIVLFADPDLATWLSTFFSRIDFTQFTETAQPFEVSIFDPSSVMPKAQTKQAKDLDVDLCVGLALINKEESES